jgi:hypothetical protein
MHDGNWVRLDYLGTAPGMWRLHPAQRGPAFAANLPNVIAELERDEIPDCQHGSAALRIAWLNAAGPELYEPARSSLSARHAARAIARAIGLGKLRDAIWRVLWRRSHNLARGEYRKGSVGG